MTAVKAVLTGLSLVLRAPTLIVLAVVLTMLSAVPFALMLRSALTVAVAQQPPIDLGSGEIDADWWSEFRAHADGLAATFTPTVIGSAAPIDNLSSLLDGTRRPWVLVVPAAVALVLWAGLWGVALRRFHHGARLPLGTMLSAGFAQLVPFVMIALVAAAAQLVLYVTLHPLLFGPLYGALTSGLDSEPAAFAIRVVLYLVFGAAIATVSLSAAYSRVIRTVAPAHGLGATISAAISFMRANAGAVAGVYLIPGIVFAVMLAGYSIVDLYGGARVGGWRGVALGQAFIVGRSITRPAGGEVAAAFPPSRARHPERKQTRVSQQKSEANRAAGKSREVAAAPFDEVARAVAGYGRASRG
jgi:hypothetical protein